MKGLEVKLDCCPSVKIGARVTDASLEI